MDRIDQLNKHLANLIALNNAGDYEEEIRSTLDEINKELGIGQDTNLSSYSTKELHEELATRDGVSELRVVMIDEVSIHVHAGDLDGHTYSYEGPVRILVNKD